MTKERRIVAVFFALCYVIVFGAFGVGLYLADLKELAKQMVIAGAIGVVLLLVLIEIICKILNDAEN